MGEHVDIQKGAADRPLLLIGAGGMLGRAWAELLRESGLRCEAVGRDRLDLAALRGVDALISDRHGVVINCAAYTNVDAAETDEAAAMRVNGEGVGALAERCGQTGTLLVHYGTDYVFNGRADRPYRIDDPIQPLNAYGRSKALGERLIRESGCRHLILRTSWLYAPWGRNFVRTMAKLAREREELRVVDDQRGRPTSCEHLARVSLDLVQRGASGTLHVTDGGECTWYGFTREIVRLIGAPCRVTPCTTAEFPRPAPRPAYSVLDLSAAEVIVGPMRDWRANLGDVIRRLE